MSRVVNLIFIDSVPELEEEDTDCYWRTQANMKMVVEMLAVVEIV